MVSVRQGSLGHLRYVLKNDLKWIPLYGFYFEQVRQSLYKDEIQVVCLAWMYLCSSK
jgi:hypothetical protein